MTAPSKEERAALRALCERAMPEYGEDAARARLELGRARATVLALLDALDVADADRAAAVETESQRASTIEKLTATHGAWRNLANYFIGVSEGHMSTPMWERAHAERDAAFATLVALGEIER